MTEEGRGERDGYDAADEAGRRRGAQRGGASLHETVFQIQNLTTRYGSNIAVKDVNLEIPKNLITAVIGPSGCGKSTFIRCLNRMNDTVPSFKLDGKLLFHGADLYGDGRRAGRSAPPDRDGLSEAEPVPEDDLRQRRLGAADPRHEEGP